MEDEDDVPDTRTYWRLVWQLPYYGGAVAATFQMAQREAVTLDQEAVPAERSAPSLPKYDVDDAPEVLTDAERAARAKGEQSRVVPIATMAMIEPGMISFGKG